MSRILFFLSFLSVLLAQCPMAFGQQAEYDDRLYLKNGSVFQGRLLHVVRGENYWFELSTGDTLVYPVYKVRRLVQDADAVGDLPQLRRGPRPYAFAETGLYFSTMGSLGLGKDFTGSGTGNVGLAFTGGYQINRWIGVGLGLGMDVYHPENGEVVYPVFAEARGYFRERNLSPYYLLRLGYGVAFTDEGAGMTEATGGVMVHPAIGMRWGGSSEVNFVTDMGFQYQRSSFTFAEFNGEVTQAIDYRRLVLRLGIVF